MGRIKKKCLVPGCLGMGASLGKREGKRYYSTRCRKHRGYKLAQRTS